MKEMSMAQEDGKDYDDDDSRPIDNKFKGLKFDFGLNSVAFEKKGFNQ